MRIVKLPQALDDLVEIALYIADDSAEAADRFFDAFESTLEFVAHNPKAGSMRRFENRIDVRMWFIDGFEKCLIFYTETEEEIVILRIIHSARDYTRFFDNS